MAVRPCVSGLPSLPSFWNSNDCLGPTAKETLKESGEEHFGGHRRLKGQESSFHDCHGAVWALGCRVAASSGVQTCLCFWAHWEQRKERGAWGWQAAPEEFLLPLSKQVLLQHWQLCSQGCSQTACPCTAVAASLPSMWR